MPTQAEMSSLPAVLAVVRQPIGGLDGGQPQPRGPQASGQTSPTPPDEQHRVSMPAQMSDVRFVNVPAQPMMPGNESQAGRGAAFPDSTSRMPGTIPGAVFTPIPPEQLRVPEYATHELVTPRPIQAQPSSEGGQ